MVDDVTIWTLGEHPNNEPPKKLFMYEGKDLPSERKPDPSKWNHELVIIYRPESVEETKAKIEAMFKNIQVIVNGIKSK